VGALKYFIPLNDYDFKYKFSYLEKIIKKIINDKIKDKEIEQLLIIFRDKINNLKNSENMNNDIYYRDYYSLYSILYNYLNNSEYKPNSSSITSSSSHIGKVYPYVRSERKDYSYDKLLNEKNNKKKDEARQKEIEDEKLQKYIKKEEQLRNEDLKQKLNEAQEQTQIEFKSTMVEK